MKIKYLGTAAAEGWPALFCDCDICKKARAEGGKNLRTRTQALIDDSLLIDFPPDAYAHSIEYGINFGKLNDLLITHSHMDHFFPVELIHRNEHFAHNTSGLMNIYGNATAEKAYQEAVNLPRFKRHPLDDDIKFNIVEPFKELQMSSGHKVIPILADHDQSEDCLLYIIESNGKRMLYAHDTGLAMCEKSWDTIFSYHYDLATIDTTMGGKSIGGKYHLGANDVVEFKNRLLHHGCIDNKSVIVMNHFSHNGGLTHDELTQFGKEHGLLCAYDSMEVNF